LTLHFRLQAICSSLTLLIPVARHLLPTDTEIDWIAYMQEVGSFLAGERDYLNMRGDTGPLVYPAGFVYIYSLFHWATDGGANIRLAQYAFVAIYVSMMAMVLYVYLRAAPRSMPLWAYFLPCISKRVHSIFVLRLFNDGVAMWLLYAAVCLFIAQRWRPGCVTYSLAVGVKMNVLLFAPGLLLLLLQSQPNLPAVAGCLAVCAAIQLVLALPFLAAHPVAYLSRSFDLGRVFEHRWTVNFRFLDEKSFSSPVLSMALLVLTVMALAAFAVKWVRAMATGAAGPAAAAAAATKDSGIGGSGPRSDSSRRNNGSTTASRDGAGGGWRWRHLGPLPAEYIAKTLFVSNFIGVAFARTLHYQFCTWYLHTLPLLCWQTWLPMPAKLAVLAAVEYAFNVFPATPVSSAALQAAHAVLLLALWRAPVLIDGTAPQPLPAASLSAAPVR
ncbi:unnamed protein product, partial [Phaeothamnion confervicola]